MGDEEESATCCSRPTLKLQNGEDPVPRRVHPQDWHYLGCTHTVSTRVAGSIGRLAQYLVGDLCTTWHVLVADDFMLEC